jgi:hypothetical protein
MERVRGVVCKDAGGANLISHHIVNNPGKYIYCLEEPATSIFESNLGSLEIIPLDLLVENSQVIITGTGWQSELEWQAIRLGRLTGKEVITYLDHWVNYRERFSRNGEQVLPNSIWVSDDHAQSEILKIFPSANVELHKNYYLQSIQNEYQTYKILSSRNIDCDRIRILYLCEPIVTLDADKSSQIVLSEFDILEDFYSQISNLANVDITLRIHPSEKADKYKMLSFRFKQSLPNKISLAKDLSECDFVVGMDTYAMYLSDCLGLKTYSTKLNRFGYLTIPKGNIRPLKDLNLESFRYD